MFPEWKIDSLSGKNLPNWAGDLTHLTADMLTAVTATLGGWRLPNVFDTMHQPSSPKPPGSIVAHGILNGINCTWSCRETPRGGTQWDTEDISYAVGGLAVNQPIASSETLPVIVRYPRLRFTARPKPSTWTRHGIYDGALVSGHSMQPANIYLLDLFLAVQQAPRGAQAAAAQLRGINTALTAALEPFGWGRTDILVTSRNWTGLKVRHGGGEWEPLHAVAPEPRDMVYLALDIAVRAGWANPSLGDDDLRNVPGIVVVDQGKAGAACDTGEALAAAFPAIQFVTDTADNLTPRTVPSI